MRRSCLLLLGLALVGPLAARASVQGLDLFGFSSPVVAWSSQAALGSGKGLQMDYQAGGLWGGMPGHMAPRPAWCLPAPRCPSKMLNWAAG